MVCEFSLLLLIMQFFGQTGPKVGRFDAGYGSSIMSRFEICICGSPASGTLV
ncbi:hypothetical protein MUK42_31923 [Musa troglodytarum]|uniref:Uncharacterized protein n=1 Tax=Musa troglodytarum TaxID=320322 RepID=A0A9E7FH03_9LILI|nr:hypothetical protein MUK42_31923 [Musa troglodytarum]